MERKNKLALFALSILCVGSAVTSVGATFAGFSAKALLSATVGSNGVTDNIFTIYFNANIWDKDDPIYFMKRYSSEDGTKLMWIPVSKVISPRINDVNFEFSIFQYDTTLSVGGKTLDTFIFVRMSPDGANIPTAYSTTDLSASVWSGSDNPKTVWNKSKVITHNSTYSYYCIDGWDESQANSCSKAIMSYNIDTSTWSGPTGKTNA